MNSLAAFLDRLDEQQGQINDVEPASLVDDEQMAQSAANMLPMFTVFAERAGVEVDELRDEIIARVGIPAQITRARCDVDVDVDELIILAASAGLQFFLAGALWEQERHLPSLDDDA